MKKILIACAGAALGAVALASVAQVKPETLVKQRQAAMTLMGKYFGPLGGMAQGRIPYNAQVVQRNADFLATLDKMPWDGFEASTKGAKSTHALPAIWSNPERFKEAHERLQSEVAKLQSVAKSGEEAAVKSQIAAVGKACGGCHENFREKL